MAAILTVILSLCLIGISEAEENISGACVMEEATGNKPGLKPVLAKHETALLLLLGFGGVSVLLAFLYMALRRYIFHDADNLDTAFDAGGQVSLGLTAVTVATQFTWPADLLQVATITVRGGIAAPFFYAAANVFSLLLFPILSVKFKIRCPGAKTFLQPATNALIDSFPAQNVSPVWDVRQQETLYSNRLQISHVRKIIHARFGRIAHFQYTILALMVNVVVLGCLTLSSKATIQALTKDASDEFVVFIMAALFGSYSFIGGLGSTFYVSYLNAVVLIIGIAVYVVKVFFSESTEHLGLGDINKMYDTLSCLEGPLMNHQKSFLTFRSEESIFWGLVIMFIAIAIAFCDQAVWQSRIASKPNDGVWGFIFATGIFYVIPSAIGTTSGLAYLVLSSQNGTHLLTNDELDTGLVTPLVAQTIFGDGGAYLVLTMTTMALMATGSGEIMAISSILVYDIYQIHIKPFRKGLENGMCIICGRISRDMTGSDFNDTGTESTTPLCTCPSVHDCPTCCHANDTNSNTKTEMAHTPFRQCTTHGSLRRYQDQLLSYKSWCILWLSVALVPFGLLVLTSRLTLNWALLYGASILTICIPGILLTILWARTSKEGIIFGAFLAMAGSISANLGVASTYPGGISDVDNFFINSVELKSVLAAGATSLGVGFLSIIVVSLVTSKVHSFEDAEMEWEKTRNIDNPLHPWADRFQDDFPGLKPGQRPSNAQMEKSSRRAALSAYAGAGIALVICVFIVPGVMYSFPVMNFDQFQGWVYSCIAWVFVMVAMVVVIAPAQEVVQIYRRYRLNKKNQSSKL